MIEIPEAIMLKNQLEQAVSGKTIKDVIVNSSPHKFAFFYGEPEDYPSKLKGKIIENITSFGNYVEMELGTTRIQLSENPNIRYIEKGGKAPAKHQLALIFSDESALYFTAQMFALLFVCEEGENDNFYYLVCKEKPSPLNDEFSFDYFMNIVNNAKQNLSAKALIATEQRIPGLGNGVLQDILFNSRIHPKTKINALSKEDYLRLFDSIKSILKKMTDEGGRNTEKDIFGNPGGYSVILSAKTYKNPCPVCLGKIEKQAYLGGSIYFCPNCQPLV